jgi:hypothetical protein
MKDYIIIHGFLHWRQADPSKKDPDEQAAHEAPREAWQSIQPVIEPLEKILRAQNTIAGSEQTGCALVQRC